MDFFRKNPGPENEPQSLEELKRQIKELQHTTAILIRQINNPESRNPYSNIDKMQELVKRNLSKIPGLRQKYKELNGGVDDLPSIGEQKV
jgi:hypothetical protein